MKKSRKLSRDEYLLKKFGRSEAEYNRVLARQGDGCKVCGSTPKTRPLHLDHDHKIENWKIRSQKIDSTWYAWPDGHEPGSGLKHRLTFSFGGRTKQEARAKVKTWLKRLSSRGILCFGCNVGLRKFYDNADRLIKAGEYLKEYQSYLAGEKDNANGFTE